MGDYQSIIIKELNNGVYAQKAFKLTGGSLRFQDWDDRVPQ
jgi:hypothetical protein